MKIELDKIRAACESRGDFPDSCEGCIANYGAQEFYKEHSAGVYARCKLGFPRAWNIAEMEQAIYCLLFNKENQSW